MDAIDGTSERQHESESPPPCLLVLVLDTNPLAWAQLAPTLPLSRAVATLLVFINAHLAFSHENKVAVIASHCQKTAWLYPTPKRANAPSGSSAARGNDGLTIAADANKYLPFAQVEAAVLSNLSSLLEDTPPESVAASSSTSISGALSLALSYINKTLLTLSKGSANAAIDPAMQQSRAAPLTARILVVSASGDLANQYIPVMNAMFGAQHSHVAIDILKLAGDSVLLQQASFTTGGVFLSPERPGKGATSGDINGSSRDAVAATNPQGLLQYLFQAFLPDSTARKLLLPPTSPHVDFRAACFCHRRIVDIGYVCSICLSIFCEDLKKELGFEGRDWPDEGVDCLTCGTRLVLRGAGGQDMADRLSGSTGEKKKKKKKDKDKKKSGIESGAGTPAQDSGAG